MTAPAYDLDKPIDLDLTERARELLLERYGDPRRLERERPCRLIYKPRGER